MKVSAAFANSCITTKSDTDRNIVIKIINKSRVSRCSPKFIKPITKRIAPAWSLKDLYGTDYRSDTEDKSDRSVKPLTTYKQLETTRKEILIYVPYTRRTTTKSSSEKITEGTSTDTTQRELIVLTIISDFVFFSERLTH